MVALDENCKEGHKDNFGLRENDTQGKNLVVADADADDDDDHKDDGSTGQHTLKFGSTISVKSEIFCLAFSEDERFLLACCGDGLVRVFNPKTGILVCVLSSRQGKPKVKGGSQDGHGINDGDRVGGVGRGSIDDVELPCTCAVFRPNIKHRERTSGVALVGFSRGEFQLWHVPSTKALEKKDANPKDSQDVPQDDSPKASLRSPLRLHRIGTEVLCCAYTRNGDTFAVGASDGIVRVYSDDSKKLLVELKPGLGKSAGHSNRVFSLKFHPDDPNILVSGGWDNCVHVWDVSRALTSCTIFGPHVCGDAVDVVGRTILTGSWRDDLQLETWDLDTGKAEKLGFWSGRGSAGLSHSGAGAARRCRLYAAAFGGPRNAPGRFVAAGGGDGANEVKVFDFQKDRALIGSLLGLAGGATSLAFNSAGSRLAVGLANGQIHLVDFVALGGSKTTVRGSKTIML